MALTFHPGQVGGRVLLREPALLRLQPPQPTSPPTLSQPLVEEKSTYHGLGSLELIIILSQVMVDLITALLLVMLLQSPLTEYQAKATTFACELIMPVEEYLLQQS